ncbi:alpha/beta hydrolase [Qipengyuania aurantiaca]|uniref:Alpha/beta hydrolase n=1 Tax=Qipengyuania aurantiaca TaxID=2867233 RepID=A0ABX8ZNE3_9SPHN|nr:alpha/beta hydrolase [Qipengyuania aurantiaca]QZD90527.1 alpha/beta hydrolase [Qipengyuania aurantiaca]
MKRRWQAGLALLGSLAILGASVSVLGNRAADKRRSELAAERALAETRHGQIEYVSWGKGPPVLVVHGAGGGFDQGRLLAEAVGGDGHLFIAVSRFGYLGSAMPSDPSTAAQAEAMLDLLDRLGIGQTSILAMSGGVPPALKFAELFPDRTERLVLLSSAPFSPFSPEVEERPIPTWAYSTLLGNDAVYWALTKIAPGQLRSAFDARSKLMDGLPADEVVFVDQLVDGFLPASDRLAGVANEGAAVDSDATYKLEAISAPSLVVHTKDDSLNPFAIAVEMAQRIPRARLVNFDQGGHLLLGHHGELRVEIDQFLEAGSQ